MQTSISIVSTLYHSKQFVVEFIDRVSSVLCNMGVDSYEIILVNDGSPDSSLNVALSCLKTKKNIVVVDLSRNFGHHYALMAGYSVAKHELIFTVDCDLETPIEVIKEFYTKMLETNADAIYGYQEDRAGGKIERLTGDIFWKWIGKLSKVNIPLNIMPERLMSRRYVNALLSMGDKNLFLGGMWHWIGFLQIGVPVKRNKTTKRKSTYTLGKKVQLFVNAVTSFSAAPLQLIFSLGVLVTVITFAYVISLVIGKILYPESVLAGWTSVSVLIASALGILMSSIGLVGIYLSKIFIQVQNRPLFVIKDVYR